MNAAETYQRAHDRIVDLVTEKDADVEVPTTPGWTIKDLIAHQADLLAAYKRGDPKEAFSPGWGDRGVKERHDQSLQECISEWNAHIDDPGDIFESPMATTAVSDVLAHEQDIRNALGKPGARDEEGMVPSIEMALSFIEKKAESAEVPPLRIVTDDIDKQLGKGDPEVELRTSTFDLFRALHGRRTLDQMRALKWQGDPEPWLPLLPIFGPTERVVEK